MPEQGVGIPRLNPGGWIQHMDPSGINDHIAIAGISPFFIGNTSTKHSGAPIFQPDMLDYWSVNLNIKKKTDCP